MGPATPSAPGTTPLSKLGNATKCENFFPPLFFFFTHPASVPMETRPENQLARGSRGVGNPWGGFEI